MLNAATTGAARRIVLLLALILASVNAPADSITYSNLVAGELVTASSPPDSNYDRYRPATGTNWYRWVVKVEKTGTNPGMYNFKFDVPQDFAAQFLAGGRFPGLLISSQNQGEIEGVWSGSGSTNSVARSGYVQLQRVYNGGFGPGFEDLILTSSNPFTIEYLCRVGSNNLVTAVRTNGFELAAGADGLYPWVGYVTNTLDTPVPYSALPDCTIQAVASGPGAVSPTNVTVKLGESAGFEIAAQTGCSVTDIRTNGVSIGGPFGMISTNYVWPNVRASGTLEAVFAFTDSGGGTDQVVNVWENDGRPTVSGTNLVWDFVVRNNSDVLPPANPDNENVTQVKMFGLYSSSQPQFGSISPWTGSAVLSPTSTTWDVTFYCNLWVAYIRPGQTRTFPIRTTIPTTNHMVRIGTLYGQGAMPSYGWQPQPNPGDPFLGPVGVDAPSYTITVQQPTNGTVSPMSAVVDYGAGTNFLITANPGYVISDIRTNGASIGAIPDGLTNTNYVWRDIRKDGSLTATFARPDPSMEISQAPPSFVDIDTDGTPEMGMVYTVSNTSSNHSTANNLILLTFPTGTSDGVERVYEGTWGSWEVRIGATETTLVVTNPDEVGYPGGIPLEVWVWSSFTNLTKRSATALAADDDVFNSVLVDVPVAPSFTLEVRSEYGTPDPGTLTNVVYGSVVTQRIERVVGDGPGKRYRVKGYRIEELP